MDIDELMTRAARAPRTPHAEGQARRRLSRIQQEYARLRATGVDPTAGLDRTDQLHADANERAQNARAAYLASLGRFTWTAATQEMTWTDEVWALLGYPPGTEQASKPLFLRHIHREDKRETCERLND